MDDEEEWLCNLHHNKSKITEPFLFIIQFPWMQ